MKSERIIVLLVVLVAFGMGIYIGVGRKAKDRVPEKLKLIEELKQYKEKMEELKSKFSSIKEEMEFLKDKIVKLRRENDVLSIQLSQYREYESGKDENKVKQFQMLYDNLSYPNVSFYGNIVKLLFGDKVYNKIPQVVRVYFKKGELFDKLMEKLNENWEKISNADKKKLLLALIVKLILDENKGYLMGNYEKQAGNFLRNELTRLLVLTDWHDIKIDGFELMLKLLRKEQLLVLAKKYILVGKNYKEWGDKIFSVWKEFVTKSEEALAIDNDFNSQIYYCAKLMNYDFEFSVKFLGKLFLQMDQMGKELVLLDYYDRYKENALPEGFSYVNSESDFVDISVDDKKLLNIVEKIFLRDETLLDSEIKQILNKKEMLEQWVNVLQTASILAKNDYVLKMIKVDDEVLMDQVKEAIDVIAQDKGKKLKFPFSILKQKPYYVAFLLLFKNKFLDNSALLKEPIELFVTPAQLILLKNRGINIEKLADLVFRNYYILQPIEYDIWFWPVYQKEKFYNWLAINFDNLIHFRDYLPIFDKMILANYEKQEISSNLLAFIQTGMVSYSEFLKAVDNYKLKLEVLSKKKVKSGKINKVNNGIQIEEEKSNIYSEKLKELEFLKDLPKNVDLIPAMIKKDFEKEQGKIFDAIAMLTASPDFVGKMKEWLFKYRNINSNEIYLFLTAVESLYRNL